MTRRDELFPWMKGSFITDNMVVFKVDEQIRKDRRAGLYGISTAVDIYNAVAITDKLITRLLKATQ